MMKIGIRQFWLPWPFAYNSSSQKPDISLCASTISHTLETLPEFSIIYRLAFLSHVLLQYNNGGKLVPYCMPNTRLLLLDTSLAGDKGLLSRKAFGRVWAGWGLSQAWYRAKLWERQGFSSLDEFLVSLHASFFTWRKLML